MINSEKIISRRLRIGYGAAELGVSGAEVLLRVSLLMFYTHEVGIRPDLASYAIALGVLWDGITDPLMGKISDNASISGQRRRPFLWPGAIGLAICLILIFNAPNIETQLGKFFYLLTTYLGANTFLTLLSVPHIALAGDMSPQPKIRMELFGWRLIFANMGLILGTLIPALIVLAQITGISPDSLSSILMGILILIGVLITMRSTQGFDQAPKARDDKRQKTTYLQSLRSILSNRDFCLLWIAYMVATIGLTLNSSLALYYYKYFLNLDDISVRGIIAFFMFIFCLAIPFWIWVARFQSKNSIIMVNVFSLGIMTAFGYPLFPPGNAIYPLIAGFLGGIFVGSVVLMDIAVADLADQQALNDKIEGSNLGLYFGFWKMGAKFSRAIALILTGHTLTWIGFVANQEPTKKIAFKLALLFGPGVGFFLLSSVVVLFIYHKKRQKI